MRRGLDAWDSPRHDTRKAGDGIRVTEGAGQITGLTGWELVFDPGTTPPLSRAAELMQQSVPPVPSERLARSEDGYPSLECNLAGLTFDLTQIRPWDEEQPKADYRHTFGEGLQTSAQRQGLLLVPSPHIATVANSIPVVRAGTMIALSLASEEGCSAVIWRPAGCAMSAQIFIECARDWIDGGAFPALGMIGYTIAPDGGLHSDGLRLFTGQEIRIEPDLAGEKGEGLQLAARLVDRLVEAAPLETEASITLPNGGELQLTPSGNGRFVIVSR